VEHLDIHFNLLFDQVINREHIMLLLRQDEDFNGAVSHACCHYGTAVRECDAVHLSVCIQDVNRPNAWQVVLQAHFRSELFFDFLCKN